ncbi:hypothetical protein CORC01_07052 [Colletotrichum orchidophilum]|uniref:Uncharacterized protein n=1 Tax=Colletotrichum orchidophilum TaxID=1209926 RepID=A0A1G4B894_9PEZI|nr:uncharacterized protein CORC01_07052 [Colletotrichum orchidophilum]OHE97637.1 hypothetical protein CORC01_07052 [Colletotrichum orchidophilum]
MSSNGQGSNDPYFPSSWSGNPQPSSWNNTPRYTPSVSSYASSSSASQASRSSHGSQSHYTHSASAQPLYDDYRMPSVYSETPAPSEYSALSTFQQGIMQLQHAPPPSRNMLYCEFQPWTGCQEQFRLDDVDSWIRHTEDNHLRGEYPAKCVCWFCDDHVYNVGQRYADPGENFSQRMHHIAHHMLYDGYRFEQRRPDFSFVEHLHQTGKLTLQDFQQATSASEGPRVQGVYPSGWRPVREEADVVVAGRGRRRRNRERRL